MSERDEHQNFALFQRDGDSAGFFLHKSIRDASQRMVLIKNIEKYGGKVLDSESGADTVLVDEKKLSGSRQDAQLTYSLSRDPTLRSVVVEPMKFVQDCIRRGEFSHKPPQRYGMGGYAGRHGTRTDYTQSDDDNLCWYISQRIPNAEEGGRLSTGVYDELVSLGKNNPDYAWARRHTAQSWRERYKKNHQRLDPIIRRYAMQAPPELPSLYTFSRRYNKRNMPAVKVEEIKSDGEVIEFSDSENETEYKKESSEVETAFEDMVRTRKRRRLESSVSPEQSITSKRHPISSPIPFRLKRKEVMGRSSKEIADDRAEGDPFELQLLEPESSTYASARNTQANTMPAPSATLVPNTSPAQPLPKTPPSVGYRNPSSITPSQPSTSFRNVVHSSPAIYKDTHPDTVTSGTEPSSRSMIIPTELSSAEAVAKDAAQAPPDAGHGQAEASITRESSHKKSSPPPVPVRVKRAAHKVASRQEIVPPSSEDETWAPYKNTRSRSHSVEPDPPSTMRRKRGRKPEVNRTDKPLEPVYEGEFEQEDEVLDGRKQQGSNALSAIVTETYQDERDVADLLTRVSVGNGRILRTEVERDDQDIDKSSDGEGTEDEGEGIKVAIAKKEEEERESDLDRTMGQKADDEEEDYDEREGNTGESKGLAIPRSRRQTMDTDIDLGRSTERPKTHKLQIILDSDDEEVDQLFGSAKDIMAAFGDSPVEMSKHTQRRSLGTFLGGSPVPAESQRRETILPSMRSRARATKPSPFAASRRISFGPASDKKHAKTPTLSGYPARPPSITSSSSERADFPLSGTRARAVKSELEQWMKDSPYQPPSGTRAAQLSQQRPTP